ncbi:MAG: hypothetical protein OZ923_04110 [Comamonadaceae bacterium]|nr:hypothetical protein [Burkholderiales bacterium]MEB2347775.1 hypothetical protein [Comamonadaceae bacterium]
MSDQHATAPEAQQQDHEVDAVESVASIIPLVIPAYGAMLIFILAMIAVTVG